MSHLDDFERSDCMEQAQGQGCFSNEQTSYPHGNEIRPNQIFAINLWRTLDCVVKLSTQCLPPFTMTTS